MSVFADQKKFMEAGGQTTDRLNNKQIALYLNLVDEEVNELHAAIKYRDAKETADAIADSIVVLIGLGLSFGFDMDRVWQQVMGSNLAKIDPETGKVIKREDGKILKPEGWKAPDLSFVGEW